MLLKKSVIISFLVACFAIFSLNTSAVAGTKDAQALADGGKWFFKSLHKQSRGFAGTFHFDKNKVMRVFIEGRSFRGKYRVVNGGLCMEIFRFWGKREKCSRVSKLKDGKYRWGPLEMRTGR